jgi:hypothetical protein
MERTRPAGAAPADSRQRAARAARPDPDAQPLWAMPRRGGDRRKAPPDRSIALAEALQALRAPGVIGVPTALLSDEGHVLCVVRPRRAVVDSPHGLAALLPELRARFCRVMRVDAGQASLSATSALSLDALCWRLGREIAAQRGLLPWLRRMSSYRLVSWPDFSAIGDDDAGRRLASLLVERNLELVELRAHVHARSVHAFLNGAALCGLLVGASGPAPHRSTATGFSGWWSSVTQEWFRSGAREDDTLRSDIR